MSIKDTLTNNSMDSFSFGGKTYTRRVDNNKVVYDISAGTDGSAFSTGWVSEDASGTPVENGANLTFVHNLGTTDIVTSAFVNSTASDTDAQQIPVHEVGTYNHGYAIVDMDANSVTVNLADDGYFDVNSSGGGTYTSLATKFFKLVIVAKMGSGGGGGTPAGSDRQLQFNDNGAFGSDANLRFDGSTAFLPRLAVGEGGVAGDEGGEIFLKHAVTNSTLAGDGVGIDIFQNKLRIYEYGPPYKGAYIDLTECAEHSAGLTNLLAGGSGGSGGAVYDSGWIAATSNSNTTFNHNLGGSDIQVQVYHATSSSGDNASIAGDILDSSANQYGARVHSITDSSLIVRTGTNVSTAQWGSNAGVTWAGNYIRVIATKGGGSTSGGGGGYIDKLSIATNNAPATFPDFDENTQVILAQVRESGSSASVLEELPVGTNSLTMGVSYSGISGNAVLSLTSGGVVSAYDTASGNTVFALHLYRFARSSASSGSSGGGASVTTDENAPTNPSDGDLWYDETNGALYVYTDSINGWIQTNGGGGGGGALTVESVLRRDTTGDSSVQVSTWSIFGRSNKFWYRSPSFTNDGSGLRQVYFRQKPTSNQSTAWFGEFWIVINGQPHQKLVQANDSYVKNETAFTTFWVNPGDEYYIEVQDTLIEGDDELFWEETNFSSGGGSGPRAYVAFNGTAGNMTDELTSANSYNIASITDNAAGDYTINYINPVSKPIITTGYEVRASSPFHALYWGIIDQTDSYARIGFGSNNVYYDHPYVSFIAH